MARIRSVKPELRTSLTAAEWPREVRYFWVLLWGYLDDHGRGVDEPRLIKADCFPLDDDLTAADIGKWLELLSAPRDDEPASVCRYTVAGRRYLHVPHWGSHQKPQHPSDSRIPACPRGGECGKGAPVIHESLTNAREDLSGGFFSAGSGDGTGHDDGVAGQQAAFGASSGIAAGQGQFMSGSREPHESLSGNGFSDTPSPPSVTTEGDGEVDGAVAEENITPAKPPRDDVERLCAHLADRIEANGSKRPAIGKKWHDAARLLLDADKRTEQQVHDAIDWCQNHEFWRANILSMPKLREQYEQLRLQAMRPAARDSPSLSSASTAGERAMAGVESGRRLQKLADEGKLQL